eukprot:TRINITY_DN34588_c0_g1_i1.p1 TRINITY_DN34588_c0_g1~~TRINITY_DN34588_c0_g1_i1.p1  ORF type:complete len:144 (-),score=21.67 TRINITY_DN34588_c0_g1_i1:136-567(-)
MKMKPGDILTLGFCAVFCLLVLSAETRADGYQGIFGYPDPHYGCDSAWVEEAEPFKKNVEHAVDGVVSKAPQRGRFQTTKQEQEGGVSVEVEAECLSETTRCSECLRSISNGLLHFCDARLVGFGRIPSSDGCSLRYRAYGSF